MWDQQTLAVGWGDFFYAGYFHTMSSDPWFLSDVLMIPFVGFSIVTAIKLFLLISCLLLAGAFLLFFRALDLPPRTSAVLLLLAFFANPQFLGRILLGRPFTIMSAITIVILMAIITRRFLLLGILMAVAVLLSQLFVFPLLLSLGGTVWYLVSGQRKNAQRLFLALLLGVSAGLLIHPLPGAYLHYLFTVFPRIPFLKTLHLGTEMGSAMGNATTSIVMLGIIALLHITLFARGHKHQAFASGLLFLDALLIFFGIAFFLWIRAIDIFWPLLIVTLAMLISIDPHIIEETMRKILPRNVAQSRTPLYIIGAYCTCVILSAAVGFYIANTANNLDAFAESLTSIPPNSHVMNVDWHLIPPELAVRPDLIYATGIDPSFNYVADDAGGYELLDLLYNAPIIQRRPTVIDGDAWTKQLLIYYPLTDFISIDRKRYDSFLPALRNAKQLAEWTNTGSLAIFAVQNREEL